MKSKIEFVDLYFSLVTLFDNFFCSANDKNIVKLDYVKVKSNSA